MVIQCHWRKILPIFCAFCIAAAICVTALCLQQNSHTRITLAGGSIHNIQNCTEQARETINNQQEAQDYSERFQRPSNQPPLANPYSFSFFMNPEEKNPVITENFKKPEDVILAYYGILKEASNLQGFSGGCGSVGDTGSPYPLAYQLLTMESRSIIPFNEFKNSFRGIGHITLLKLYPAYSPAGTPKNLQYYMIEIETIAGEKEKTEKQQAKSRFAYYYGLVTVENTAQEGYRIKKIDYLPEDFLCAPYHGWSYDAEALVGIVYMDNLNIINKIDRTEQEGNIVHIYASGTGGQYRFDFIRITNGYDILLHENIYQNGKWEETSLLLGNWKNLKLSIDNPVFSDDTFSVGG